MEGLTALLAIVVIAAFGILASVAIMRRQRHELEDRSRESPYATSTEGQKVCGRCGRANAVADSTCSNCGAHLSG